MDKILVYLVALIILRQEYALSLVRKQNISTFLLPPKTIIFDMTNSPKSEINGFTTFQSTVPYYSSEVIYLGIDFYNNNESLSRGSFGMPWAHYSMKYYKISGLSFLFNSRDAFQQYFQNITVPLNKEVVLEYIHGARKIKALILQVDPMYGSLNNCECSPFNNGLRQFFQDTLKMRQQNNQSNFDYGVEYNNQLITCCQNSAFGFLKIIDLAVFVLEIEPKNVLLSPNMFADQIRPQLDENRKFVRFVSSDVKILIKIKISKNDELGISDSIYFKYLANIKIYLEHWLRFRSLDENFILDSFPENIKPNTFYVEQAKPILFESTTRVAEHHMENFKSACQIQYLIKSSSSSFYDFIYKPNSVESLTAMSSECHTNLSSYNFRKFRAKTMSILLTNGGKWKDILGEIVAQRKKPNGLRFENLLIQITDDFPYLKNSSSDHAKNIDYSPLLDWYIFNFGRVGCYAKVGNVKRAVLLCGPVFKKYSLLYIEWVMEESNVDKELPKTLLEIYNQKKIFNQLYPNGELHVSILISNDYTNPFFPATVKRTVARQTIYCDKAVQNLYETYNAILNFADIHQLGKIVLQSVVHYGNVGGWWSSIETLKTVNRTATNFPLLVQRNLPLDIKSKLMLPNNFECIPWSESLNENGQQFVDIGGIIDLATIKNLYIELELQTLLLLTFSKFTFVELVFNDVLQIHKLEQAITEELYSTIQPHCTNQGYCYLFEIPFKSFISDYKSIILKQPWRKSIGLHLALWEDNSSDSYTKFQRILQQHFWNISPNSTTIKLGITIHSCVDEMNLQIIRLRSLPFINLLSYVICVVSPIQPNNHNKDTMQTFLDTQFYTNMYFQAFNQLKHIRVYFRVQFLTGKCNVRKAETESYLRLMNDLNEHSKAYGIKYTVNGFEQTTKTGCSSAWWRIDNTSDLSKLSAYVEQESEYFGQPTKFKLKLNSTRDTEIIIEKSESSLIVIISSVLLLILISTILGFWYRLKTLRKRYLNDEDVNIFRHGHLRSDNSADILNLIERLKFDSKFEIERDNIQLGKHIGKGRFGYVCKSVLNNELQVAVKLPHETCLKEAFISMLAEVKILCYIGHHPFVIEFIGAYTKDIKRGKLYIVTEYCERGSLQSYLHEKKSKSEKNVKDTSVDMYQLYTFSYQIALGMCYIAEKQVIHGDLSTRNILLSGELVCKIGDFGLSRRLYENAEYVKKTKEPLPWRWSAIETMKNRIFTTKSDVWSFGVAVWEIFTYGDLPYQSKEFTEEFIQEVENGLRLSKAKYSNDTVHEKLMECWNLNMNERPDFNHLATFFNVLRRAEYDT